MIRRSAVAGSFYPAETEELRRVVTRHLGKNRRGIAAQALLVPHAGYTYSGNTAGAVYSAVEVPGEIIILGPNHTGQGPAISVMSEGEWETPLGSVRINADLAEALVEAGDEISSDKEAHRQEHSIEVQLPFLQMIREDFRFVPICVGTQQKQALMQFGKVLAEAIRVYPEDILVVLSSDMSHYEAEASAHKKDREAIQALEAVDPDRLDLVVREQNISMCGAGPAIAVLSACAQLGVSRGVLCDYSTSADTSGNRSQVVGYAGMVFH